ncbi:MAG: chromosomal replication initiator protein DnaA [Candidatus Blackburnbacteria bacterium RIFCSPHIGHO2_02_FULL_39_13]|uniref:Chromosomal replication initiator protein DnaA n=1 Tax=Candidatus Blackburnbacteria bacterium RIFCSPLOWO2_01_FULL_40_20 TaxID=1797519 RepID=A0A1G1VFQ3_9BACT|nr:MAG: Chromosomal replication initiator protein DnaA [Microgenomates group bacterium GW2011_GWA2_39_19]OGY07548.1 MAG: chromosomal replication initiator protein DnaA [Candidatus Blackburnbacteria bacterium RIFCSPHIGHO2_01_FULL_40_17]OGY08631.1 MAG: chromosomal replication initiator protein DnaA [Candidatus Blackburnbacteria bacterium RIFCSPHIGHO2_02_FULL_39_13]OGY14265.1 MAG: chromosomal replication initiator protein DnaA [Candidatus Blackburnbacteria bacterium RIFCSPLOWO2_01_FULL_40_20]OGY14
MDKNKIWQEVLSTLKVSVSSGNYSTWLSQTFITSTRELDNGRQLIEIGCPSSFIADTIEKRYFGLILDSLNRTTGYKNDITFTVKQNPATEKKQVQENSLFSQSFEEQSNINDVLKRHRIRPGFTFENFAVSSSNQMAWAAAEAVSKDLGKAYNPLFLWGGVGIGKTHLMLAIAHKLLLVDPTLQVLYSTGEEFTTEIVEAIKNKNTDEFKKRYRKLKLLLLDDVQFIAGKEKVQEEFFHSFNALLREGGQVVLTSDRPPTEIEKLEDRLRSRFEAGLIIDISPPDFELLSAITLIKAQERGIELPMEIAQTIGANFDNARRIEGFLTRLMTEAKGRNEPITMELTEKILGKTSPKRESTNLNPKAILPQAVIDAVAEYYSISRRKLLSDSRVRPVAYPRQILMYLLRIEFGLPLQEVGRLIGGRDHTTVMHAVGKISTRISTDNALKRDLLGIKQSVSGQLSV